MELIDKSKVVAELEKLYNLEYDNTSNLSCGKKIMLRNILLFLDTLEVKEVDIAEMADGYYDALMQEADWMDEGTMGHCRLAYYTGCKDVLNKIRKGE